MPTPMTGSEKIPADTGRSPPSAVVTTRQLSQFAFQFDPGQNWLIAGDAAQNLWQRGTTGAVSSGPIVWGPDRWAYWSAGTTPVRVSQDTLAGVSPLGFGAAYRMQRSAGSTGTDQLCLAQVISSANSLMLQGQVVEVDLTAFGGPNMSANRLMVYLVAGTGVDEGVQKLAFGLNGGGGGSSGWTGQTNVVAAGFAPLLSGAMVQPAIVGNMPLNETEAAVVLCWAPAGTAGVQDWIDFSGLQLRKALGLAQYVSATAPYIAQSIGTPQFVWRLGNQEAGLQYMYYWQLTEGAGLSMVGGSCRQGASSTESDCYVPFPFALRKVPTMSYSAGFATDANSGGVENCTGLGTASGIGATVVGVAVSCVVGANVKGASFLYGNGGSGVIRADAELD